ncbi:MAG: HXXEE domain-containing protein, partial [Desulfobacterales bacterium]|nr:HXXEE domain-containing protein [Desulfobacterales bacterium]
WVNETLHGQMNIRLFSINNTIFMLILIGFCVLVFKKRNTVSVLLLFAWVSGKQFWNFVFHLYAQFKFDAYSPGSLTGIFLYFPIYAGMTYIALKEKYIKWYLWLLCFIIGLIGMGLTIWGGLYRFEKLPLEKWI